MTYLVFHLMTWTRCLKTQVPFEIGLIRSRDYYNLKDSSCVIACVALSLLFRIQGLLEKSSHYPLASS